MIFSSIREKAEYELNILLELEPDNKAEEFRYMILDLCDEIDLLNKTGSPMNSISKLLKLEELDYLADIIDNLCYKCLPITPVYDITNEWGDPFKTSDGFNQFNHRCYPLVRTDKGVHYMDAVKFKDNFGCKFTTGYSINDEKERINSNWYIKEFPFTPKTFIIDVIKETPNSRSFLKDKSQLDAVYNYYKGVVL